MEAQPLVYRRATDDDIPALLTLWRTESGWGDLTADEWHRWYRNTPFGDALVVVAVSTDGEVVGQVVFTPSRVHVGDQEVAAYRLAAPLVQRAWRSAGSLRDTSHPAIQLYAAGYDFAKADGAALIYSLPEVTWMPLLRHLEAKDPRALRCGTDRLAWSLRANAPWNGRGAQVVPAPQIDEEVLDLWRRFRMAFDVPVCVARTVEWIRYRTGALATIALRDASGILAGFAAVHPKTGLITELMALDEVALVRTLRAVSAWVSEAFPEVGEVKALGTTAILPCLAEAGFARVDYRFGFAVAVVDPTLVAATDPDGWHVVPGD